LAFNVGNKSLKKITSKERKAFENTKRAFKGDEQANKASQHATDEPDETDSLLEEDDDSLKSWMGLMPYAFTLLEVFLLLIFFASYSGIDGTELDNLTNALSGQAIGASLTLIAGGLSYIYLNFILDTRLQNRVKQVDDKTPKSKVLIPRNYWELTLATGLFFIAFLLVLFLPESTLGNNDSGGYQISYAICMFFVTVLAGGVILGYSLKFSALLAARSEAEMKIDGLLAIQYNYEGFVEPQDFSINGRLIADIDYCNRLLLNSIAEHNNEITLISRNQTEMADHIAHEQAKHKKKTQVNQEAVKKLWQNFVDSLQSNQKKDGKTKDKGKERGKNDEPNQAKKESAQEKTAETYDRGGQINNGEEMYTDHIARRYFPELFQKINDQLAAIKTRVTQVTELTHELEGLRLGSAPRQVELQKAIDKTVQQGHALAQALATAQTKMHKAISQEQKHYQFIVLNLKEGYYLGVWYNQHINSNQGS